MMATSSLLLKVADDTVLLFQSLITLLSEFYEANVSNMSSHSGQSLSSSNLEVLQLTCHELSENLASLWPCQKQYVAVFGRTGCGKSTLLNLLLSMMCTTAEPYNQGIKTDSARAVLRETARYHGNIARAGQPEAGGDRIDSESCANSSKLHDLEYKTNDLLINERLSIGGLLGICCAQDRQLYMNKHISHYDKYPFLLQNGRLGDAGTTKVTVIEYGPKFVGYIRMISRKKLRKKLRDLRHLLENPNRTSDDEQSLAELKEFWYCVRQLVDIPSYVVHPNEEQINRVIDILGNKRQVLDRENAVETQVTEGCTIDRIFVREGIKERLRHQLGKLTEDLRIEVPVPSFEGGIGFLDVPGTNDPRVLHQRETRDAIDQTSLILLVLDRSVMDVETQNSLVDSPLLEKMLMDESMQCSLVVVGIVEKDSKKGQSPRELVDGFDPKESILKTLKKIFKKIASRLCKSKRIPSNHALERVERLFISSVCLIPVLPFLCASLQLSASNPALHKLYCESEKNTTCPLFMSKQEVMEKCMETNIPQLLEKLQSVRVPPKSEELCRCINNTIGRLRLLTQPSVLDTSYVRFLKREWDQAKSVVADKICLQDFPDSYVNIHSIDLILDNCAKESILQDDEIEDITNSVGEELLSQLQTGRFSLGPFMVRGFRPEVIGQRAQELIQSVNSSSQKLMELALHHLNSLRGDEARIEATVDKIEAEYQPQAIGLYDQLLNRWDLSLRRMRAKCFCGGIDGGLLGQVREALRKAYYGSLKFLFKKLKQQRDSKHYKEILFTTLRNNDVSMYAVEAAKLEVKKAIESFWKSLLVLTNNELQFLWKAWQEDIENLAQSAMKVLHANQKIMEKRQPTKRDSGDDKLKLFHEILEEKMEGLESLSHFLIEPTHKLERSFHYGYSLLQCNPQLCSHLFDAMAQESISEAMDKSTPAYSLMKQERGGDEASLQVCLENTNSKEVSAPTGTQMGEDTPGQAKDSNQTIAENVFTASKRDRYNNQSELQDGKFLQTGDDVDPQTPNLCKLGSFGGRRRTAQVLSEAESHKLQKREIISKRPKKY